MSLRVLIAEDDAAIRSMLCEVVEELGHTVLLAEDGAQAWRVYQASGDAIDVVISDWLMRDLDGLEFCRRVRGHGGQAGRYTYFILVTALGGKHHMLEGMRAGVDDFLTKPLDLDDLEARLLAAERVSLLHRRREALLRLARCAATAAEAAPHQLMEALLGEAIALAGGDDGEVCHWDAGRRLLVPVWDARPVRARHPALSGGAGASGRAAVLRAPVVIDDCQREHGPETFSGRTGVRAAVAVPLLHEGQLLGTLAVTSRDPQKRFGTEDTEALELLAGTASAALAARERARLEGVLLAARTAQHELNNRLALTRGYAELLTLHPGLPPELQEAADEALRGADEAADILRQLQQVTRIHETHWGQHAGTTIDLGRSAA